jgi:hypothetical protein
MEHPCLSTSARHVAAVAERSQALTGIIKSGYSPQEQYATDSRLQGPWTDLYALGATLYRAVTGRAPEEATLRMTDDRTPAAAQTSTSAYRSSFLAAIDACLNVKPGPSSIRSTAAAHAPWGHWVTDFGRNAIHRHASNARWTAVAATLAVLALVYGGYAYSRRLSSEAPPQTTAQGDTPKRHGQNQGSRARRLPQNKIPPNVPPLRDRSLLATRWPSRLRCPARSSRGLQGHSIKVISISTSLRARASSPGPFTGQRASTR